jgi:membrane associated rhomboid family serine protease
VAETDHNSDNFCYRHPQRQSYILCQRCGRTICPECQTQASVGVHCPECVAEAKRKAPKRKPAVVTAFRKGSDKPVVTLTIIVINLVVFALQFVTNDLVTGYLLYRPIYTFVEPWTMITSLFVHGSVFHVGLNMLALYLFGPVLESLLGRTRYLALYFVSGFGGSVAVLWFSDPLGGVLGASGAIFGLLGAFFVIQRKLGGNAVQLLIVIGLNLALGFFIPGISWQAHVGGVIIGALIALIFLKTRQPAQARVQVLLVSSVVVALLAVTVIRIIV